MKEVLNTSKASSCSRLGWQGHFRRKQKKFGQPAIPSFFAFIIHSLTHLEQYSDAVVMPIGKGSLIIPLWQ